MNQTLPPHMLAALKSWNSHHKRFAYLPMPAYLPKAMQKYAHAKLYDLPLPPYPKCEAINPHFHQIKIGYGKKYDGAKLRALRAERGCGKITKAQIAERRLAA